jgi:hypothetical protein
LKINNWNFDYEKLTSCKLEYTRQVPNPMDQNRVLITKSGFTTKGRITKGWKMTKRGRWTFICARSIRSTCLFRSFFFIEYQMVEEIWAEFHRVIVGLRRNYKAVVRLSVFSIKITSFVRIFLIMKKKKWVIQPFDFWPKVCNPKIQNRFFVVVGMC